MDGDIPPIMRNQPDSGPYDALPYAPPPPPNGHHPRRSIRLADFNETAYQGKDYQQVARVLQEQLRYLDTRKALYKGRYHVMLGCCIGLLVVVAVLLFWHVQIILAAGGPR